MFQSLELQCPGLQKQQDRLLVPLSLHFCLSRQEMLRTFLAGGLGQLPFFFFFGDVMIIGGNLVLFFHGDGFWLLADVVPSAMGPLDVDSGEQQWGL